MKKILLIKLSVALVATTIFFSCKKENHSATETKNQVLSASVTSKNGRLVFKNSSAYNETASVLLNKDLNYLTNWEKDFNFTSLRSDSSASQSYDRFGFPAFYGSILNNKGEYMIGDTIVYFNNGYKYLIPNNDEALLAKIKTDPSIAALKFKAGIVPVNTSSAVKSGSLSTQSTSLSGGGTDARYQHQFLRNGDPNSQRKFVFEIFNYVESAGQTSICYVRTRIKQEYLGGNKPGNWIATSTESYEKKITGMNFQVAFFNTGNGTLSYVNGSNINLSETDITKLDYTLCTFQASRPDITVTLTGNYYANVLPPWNTDGKSTYTANVSW
ncbi:hypothetical protein [Mucilaginibacter flavus]|uniref:hypothetical protein n=1 Tax=Mucilaginibacter flavus TaxID=931504 RepID=UPI0025B5D698|nr:hypothetical protein [Mucilaginibacter flavus]MDN3583915.1 hypothetical protein [Mucilaginibacter flavus]